MRKFKLEQCPLCGGKAELECKVNTKEIDAAVERMRELGDVLHQISEKAQALIETIHKLREVENE